MNGVLWAWVLEKAWKIDTKGLMDNGTEFENDARLKREPMKIFQKSDRTGKLRRPCDNPS